jgi:hypothetical protein
MFWGILLVLLIILGLSLIPIKIYFRIYRQSKEFHLTFILKIWKLPITFKINNLVTRMFWHLSQNRFWKKQTPQDLKSSQIAWYRVFSRIYLSQQIIHSTLQGTMKTIRKIAKPIRIKKFRLYTEVALQDAAQTALAVGVLWWFWGIIYGQFASLFKIAKSANNLAIIPNYREQNLLNIDLSCILEFPLGHIIIIIYYLFTNAEKIRLFIRRVSNE